MTACKRCNAHKGNMALEDCGMQLLALPYVPNHAEYLALTHSGRILGDQMILLKRQFSARSRLLPENQALAINLQKSLTMPLPKGAK